MSDKFVFEPEKAFKVMKEQFLGFMKSVGSKDVVIGISGGKDSSVSAAFCAKALGPEHVIGIMMPNGFQKDIDDSRKLISHIGIVDKAINIRNAYDAIIDQLHYNSITESENARINLPPRIRMCVQYAVAQSMTAVVMNNDNRLEILAGYYTIFGDGAGSYGLLRELTVREVIELGRWLGLPDELVDKTPGDGLQDKGDEERMGISYEMFGKLVRREYDEESFPDKDMLKRIMDRYHANKFKSNMIRIKSPKLGYSDFFAELEKTQDAMLSSMENVKVCK